jgi:hypothetical protein
MMSDRLMTELVTKQSFDPPKTAANDTLKQAARAYRNGEMTKSANLFLEAWRILDIEHKNYLGGRFELLPPWNADISRLVLKDLARESQARVLMGHCALTDLALACLGSTSKYKFLDADGYFSYTLNCCGLEDEYHGQITTEDLDLDGKIWPRGSRVYRMFRLSDDMGFTIKNQESFAVAAYSFACHGLCALKLWPGIGKEHSEFKSAVEETLTKIMDLTSAAAKKESEEKDVREKKEKAVKGANEFWASATAFAAAEKERGEKEKEKAVKDANEFWASATAAAAAKK